MLLRRPPGRKAFLVDVFYFDFKLLDREAKLNENNGGCFLTALPVIKNQASIIFSYIPTMLFLLLMDKSF